MEMEKAAPHMNATPAPHCLLLSLHSKLLSAKDKNSIKSNVARDSYGHTRGWFSHMRLISAPNMIVNVVLAGKGTLIFLSTP